MHAALVEDFSTPPRFGEIATPVPKPGEVLLKVRAAALSNLVRGQALQQPGAVSLHARQRRCGRLA